MSNLEKITPVQAELFLTDKRTEMLKLTVAFRNIAKGPYRLTTKYLPHTKNTTIYYVLSDELQGYMFRQPHGHLRDMKNT